MNYGLLALTFVSVNLDFFFMLIFLLNQYRLDRVILGYLVGNIILLTLSFTVGKALALFLPEWVLGLLGFLPIWLALHDNDEANKTKASHSEVLSVLLTYLSVCSGCNLAIFLPVLTGETWPQFLLTLCFIGGLAVLVVLLIKLIANIPAVTRLMQHDGEKLMRVCYILVGLWVFWDSGLISHVLAWL